MKGQNFLYWILKNAERVKKYTWGKDGKNGECDCIGLVIGALRLAGIPWQGIHGTNYTARYKMEDIRTIESENQLESGELVFKVREKGDAKYDLPSRYKNHPDQKDYYHVGIVEKINPLCIIHCTSGGIRRDDQLGSWRYHGELSGSIAPVKEDAGYEKQQETEGASGIIKTAFAENGKKINVRKENHLTADLLFQVPSGEKIQVTEERKDWSRIVYQGKEGWMMTRFITGYPDFVTLILDRAAAKSLQKALENIL